MTFPPIEAMAASVRRGERPPDAWLLEARDRLERAPRGAVTFIPSAGESARASEALASALGRGEALPLAGVPVAIKGNICRRGWPTACGSRALRGWISPEDATVVQRLEAAGALLLAQTALDEFAMGSLGEGVENPAAPGRRPGGSSSGSAALVAAGVVPLSLGSDTGGSVRLPAAWCGVSGLRPTYGLLSRRGLVAHASSMDTVGLLGARAADLAVALRALAGRDPGDATSRPAPEPGGEVTHALVWLPEEEAHPAVVGALRAAEAACAAHGLRTQVTAPDDLEAALASYYVLASVEAASNLARYDGLRYGFAATTGEEALADTSPHTALLTATRALGFGAEVRRRVLLGTLFASHDWREEILERARRAREDLSARLRDRLGPDGVLLLPASFGPPPRCEEALSPAETWALDRATTPASLAGLPALVLPAPDGHPVQLVGAEGADLPLLEVARAIEEARA